MNLSNDERSLSMATTLPSWLLPVGLIAGVGALLFVTKKPSVQPNDVVGVLASNLLTAGQPAQLPVTLPPTAKAALQVTSVQGDVVSGSLVGYVDPASNTLVRLQIPVGLGPFSIAKTAVTDIFRGGKRI